jgi:PBSX family phage terminase large subunit
LKNPIPILRLKNGVFIPAYKHLIDSKYNIEFLYGSRDSGKSYFVAQKLIMMCITEKYFFCPLIRKVANTVKDSQYKMIKDVIENWKISSYFQFTVSPAEIRFYNGNKFIVRGLDEPKKIKSITNPSVAWLEEASDFDTEDWVLVLTSLRSNYGKTQVWVSFNPDTPNDYTENYLYKTFFEGRNELSFSAELTLNTDKGESKIEYRATHTTYNDNPFCTPERAFFYENLKQVGEYDYFVYALGRWAKRMTGGGFLKQFNLKEHVQRINYNPNQIIHISIDNNKHPYIAVTFWQLEKAENTWKVKQIHEICAATPNNLASKAGILAANYLKSIGYNKKVLLYGDRSTKNGNTIDENMRSFAEIFADSIKNLGYQLENKMLNYSPSVAAIGDFVNAILENKFDIRVLISDTCKNSISDYIETKEDKDGTILKLKIKDPKTGITYEPHGHFLDNFKDLIISIFKGDFDKYQNRFNLPETGGIKFTQSSPKITF